MNRNYYEIFNTYTGNMVSFLSNVTKEEAIKKAISNGSPDLIVIEPEPIPSPKLSVVWSGPFAAMGKWGIHIDGFWSKDVRDFGAPKRIYIRTPFVFIQIGEKSQVYSFKKKKYIDKWAYITFREP